MACRKRGSLGMDPVFLLILWYSKRGWQWVPYDISCATFFETANGIGYTAQVVVDFTLPRKDTMYLIRMLPPLVLSPYPDPPNKCGGGQIPIHCANVLTTGNYNLLQ